jgi:hypothetical protein
LIVGDVVLAGFRICSDRWKDLLKVTAKTVFPAAIFGSLLIATYMPDVLLDAMGNNLDPEVTDEALRAIASSEWVNLGIAVLIYVLVTAAANVIALNACIHISLNHHDAREVDHSDALRVGFSKLWSMLWLFTMTSLLTLIGFVLCILPGIWLFVSWTVAPVVLLREGLKGSKAMGRSFRMVKPRFWPALVVVILEVACIFIIQTILGGLPGLFLPASADANSFAVFFSLSVGGAIGGLFGVALHAAIATELYFGLVEHEEEGLPPGQLAPIPPPPPPPMGL